MTKSKLTNIKITDNQTTIDVEVFGIRLSGQSSRWYYAGKIEKNDDLILATHRKGTTNLFKVNDLSINYRAAQDWLEVQEFLSGTMLCEAYEFLDFIGDVKRRSPLELSNILSSLPNYVHGQFMAMCRQELPKSSYQEFLKYVEKNKLFLNSDDYIFEQAKIGLADLGF